MKVKQTKMRLELDPARPYKETVVEICYDSTDKNTVTYKRVIPEHRFYVKLPQVVADSLGFATSRGDTQEEALKAFENDLERFRKLKVERNRVILYHINANPDTKRGKTNIGYMVDVWAGTYIETVCIDGAGLKRYSYEAVESSIDYSNANKGSYLYNFASCSYTPRDGMCAKNQVPWTEQNEAFFIWVQLRMAELVARLAEISEPEKMVEAISAGRLLPLYVGKDEEQEPGYLSFRGEEGAE